MECFAGTEFDFTFVTTGTTIQARDFDYPYYISFFDVDGDTINDDTGTRKPFFELVSILGATEAFTDFGDFSGPNTTDLAVGRNQPSNAPFVYANATTNVGNAVLFANPSIHAVPEESRPGVAVFKIGLQGSCM